LSMKITRFPIPNEIPTVVESMVGNVDCVYTPTRQHDRGLVWQP